MDNVIDAKARWGQKRQGERRPALIDRVRQTTRVKRDDAIMIGRRLGEIAEQLSPERPLDVARQWFDELWNGERWQKRKRYILLTAEPDPDIVLSTGSDWAALIERAAASRFPDSGMIAEKERERVYRDILRGTSFLPEASVAPLRSETARTLLSALAKKICDMIGERTELERLWQAVQEVPFEIHSFWSEPPTCEGEDCVDPQISTWLEPMRFIGDAYSKGPLGAVALRAGAVSAIRSSHHSNYRFEPLNEDGRYDHSNWQFPIVNLGLVGHRHEVRLFVIPHDFVDDLEGARERIDAHETYHEEVVHDWLIAKGIIAKDEFARLPEIEFCPTRGYGWKPFVFDEPRNVWLEVRPKPDGSLGIWFESPWADVPSCYPRVGDFDALKIEAEKQTDDVFTFLAIGIEGDSRYEYMRWPDYSPEFMNGENLPPGAVGGLLEYPFEERPDVAGWIDDFDNAELQDFIFRSDPSFRFCASIDVDDGVPPPCKPGTIAAAIFSNAGCERAGRLITRLLEQAQLIAENGLAFHEAILAANRSRIEAMMED